MGLWLCGPPPYDPHPDEQAGQNHPAFAVTRLLAQFGANWEVPVPPAPNRANAEPAAAVLRALDDALGQWVGPERKWPRHPLLPEAEVDRVLRARQAERLGQAIDAPLSPAPARRARL